MIGHAARAEDVWTCTQASVTDAKQIHLRYALTKSGVMFDEFNQQWSVIAYDDHELVAVFTMGKLDPNARTLVIDTKTGDMELSIINMHSTDAPSRHILGTCTKD